MLPPIDKEDLNDLAEILTAWFEGHDPKELDTLIAVVKSRLALSAGHKAALEEVTPNLALEWA